MKVSYKDFKGELIKLERNNSVNTRIVQTAEYVGCSVSSGSITNSSITEIIPQAYNLTLYDEGKKATVSFDAIDPRDIRFLAASVAIC